jgi:predicted nucleotidyltransferase component of viral defense system
MNQVVEQMLKAYNCRSVLDYENALKEIIQEISLLGMWRAKFFEHGAFYGGTALRILHGLKRFSEDMDFSLLAPNPGFRIDAYEKALQRELESYGFEVVVERKAKSFELPIESAFVKANTLIHLLKIRSDLKTHKNRLLKVKIEVDTNPPGSPLLEVRTHFRPIPYTVKTFALPSLFARKIAAALYRPYKLNTKGRDWYDFLWYVGRNTPVDLAYLRAVAIQLGKWSPDKILEINDLKALLVKRIAELDIRQAQNDVLPFVKDQHHINAWNRDMFLAATSELTPIKSGSA